MNPAAFENLSLIAKSSFLWSKGHCIVSFKQAGTVIKLYTIYNFFAEVAFNRENMQVEMITVVSSFHDLEPYAALIKLPPLFKR